MGGSIINSRMSDRIASAVAVRDDMVQCSTDQLISVSSLGLPSFRPVYLFLCRVPLEIMYACLASKLEHQPQKPPSPHSLRQLLHECKQTIAGAVVIRQKFLHFAKPALIAAAPADIEKHMQVIIY
jgi:hypothetical protein